MLHHSVYSECSKFNYLSASDDERGILYLMQFTNRSASH